MSDTGIVKIRNVEFQANHGATAGERRSARRFQVDVDLTFDMSKALESDRLADTINYKDVCEVVVEIGTSRPSTSRISCSGRLGTPRLLANVQIVTKEARKKHKSGAGHLELPRPLHRDSSHDPQCLFRCAEANRALDEEAPTHERQHDRYSRPLVVKHDDDGSKGQIEKPVHKRAGFSFAAYKDEELNPCPGLQDVRETEDSEQNDGKDFDRPLHSRLPVIH